MGGAGQHAREDEKALGVVGERLERVDLLGDLHGPELGGHARAHAPRQREPGEHGAELQHHRFPDQRADEVERNRVSER